MTTKRKTRSRDTVAEAMQFLCDVVEDYEREHPNWRIEYLFFFFTTSMRFLRETLENANEKEVDWPNPAMTYPFPVKWDWEAWGRRGRKGAGILYDALTPANTRTSKLVSRTIANMMVQHLVAQTLQWFTNGVGYHKRRNEYFPILSAETAAMLNELGALRKKKQALKEFLRPFSVGGPRFIWSDEDIKAGRGPISSPIDGDADIPAIDFSCRVAEHEWKGALYFQIHPLVIDGRKKEAFYPLTIGLCLLPVAASAADVPELMSQPWANPATWDRTDQTTLWDALEKTLTELGEGVLRAPVPKTDRTVAFSGAIKISGTEEEIAEREAALMQMLSRVGSHGDIIELSYKSSDDPALLTAEVRLRLVDMVCDVEQAASAESKGRSLEELIVLMLALVPGFEVKTRVRTETEEIDLVVLNQNDDVRWKNEKPLILLECKNWSSSCGKNELIQFREKLKNRRGRSNLGFLISWNGFAETVNKELLRDSHDDVLIVPISGKAVAEAARTGKVLELLTKAWDAAVMT